MILADLHTHSQYSTDAPHDGTSAPALMAKAAYERGLKTICITDHMDLCFPGEPQSFVFDVSDYFRTLQALRDEWQGRLEILIGVELGLRNEPDRHEGIRKAYDDLVASYPFDFVLGSTHIVRYEDPYERSYWKKYGAIDGLLAYFEAELFNMETYSCFHSCAHLDYALRYVPANRRIAPRRYDALVEATLETLVRRDIALEINVKSLARGLAEPNPSLKYIRRYRELGGRMITFGSDAHRPGYIGDGLARGEEFARAAGFTEYTIFRGGKPEFVPFD